MLVHRHTLIKEHTHARANFHLENYKQTNLKNVGFTNFSTCSAIIIPSTNFVVFSSSSFLRALIFEQIDWVEILYSIFFPLETDTTQLSVPDLEILSVRSMFENQIDPN